MSTLMFWNKQNGHDNKNGKKNWLHAPDNLVDGHIVYRAKFLGKWAVDQPKGIEVVKDAIRHLQLQQQMKKLEQPASKKLGGGDQNNSWKAKKVELSVSINGVAVRDAATQLIMHQYPLYRISYCADEKGEKKYFSFIAKSAQASAAEGSERGLGGGGGMTPNDSVVPSLEKEKHECFVFISSKNASDITLTIGQAFDLAYTKYKTDSEKTSEVGALQAKNSSLEKTVAIYRQRLKELSEHLPRGELELLMQRMGVKDLFEVPQENGVEVMTNGQQQQQQTQHKMMMLMNRSSSDSGNLLTIDTNDDHLKCPPVPSRNLHGLEAVFKNGSGGGMNGGKNDELLLDPHSDSDSDFDPRAFESDDSKTTNDFFGFEPTKTLGQQIFAATNNNFVNNMNAVNTSVSNGFGGGGLMADTNNNGNGAIPAPLLAPPPKSSTQRRSGGPQPAAPAMNNGKIMDNQDLFGSTPFHTAPISFETASAQHNNNQRVAMAFDSSSLAPPVVVVAPQQSSSSASERHNPFKFFDRIDQEIEENKQRLKETVPLGQQSQQAVQSSAASASADGGGGGGIFLEALYEQSRAKQGGYNAFMNMNFDQLSMKTETLSNPVPLQQQLQQTPPVILTTSNRKNGNYNAFSNEVAFPTPNPSATGHKNASDLQQNLIWG